MISFSANAKTVYVPQKQNQYLSTSFKEKSPSVAFALTLVPQLAGMGMMLGGMLGHEYLTTGGMYALSFIGLGIHTFVPTASRIYTEDTAWNTLKFPVFKLISLGVPLITSLIISFNVTDLDDSHPNLFGTMIIMGIAGLTASLCISIWELIDAPISAKRYNKKMKKLYKLSISPIINIDKNKNQTYGAAVSYRF